MEVLLTAGLVSTILGTASGARNIGSNGALAVAVILLWLDFGRHQSAALR